MTIIEAIKSGKRFRPIGWDLWYSADSHICWRCDHMLLEFETEPEPKPKRHAWIHETGGDVRFMPEGVVLAVAYWTRAPWLDEK
jgi:hypothetical protein